MNAIKSWFSTFFRTWIQRYSMVVHDEGVLIFFLLLPLAYPVIYTVIYNPELVNDVPMVVVDNCRTADSRHLISMFDASPHTEIVASANDLNEARTMLKERKAYSILVIPEDYSRRIGRMEQATLPVYCDMSLLLRYRSVLFAVTDIQLELGSQIRTTTIDESPIAFAASSVGDREVGTDSFFLGDVSQGFASFIMIGVLVLIMQQSLMLGVFMLAGGSAERRRQNGGHDPMDIPGPASAAVLGRTMCYVTIYLPLMVYMLHYVPLMFDLPHVGSWWMYLTFLFPMLFASAFLAESIRGMVTERETSMVVWVFTSVVFLFLSGLTWPHQAMSPFWATIADLIPATWGVNGFILIDSNGASLSNVATQYHMMWLLTAVYFVIAVIVERHIRRRAVKR